MDEYKFQMSYKNSRGDMLNVRGDTQEEFAQNWKWAQEHFGLPAFMDVAVSNKAPNTTPSGIPYIDVENIKLASGGEHPRWVVMGGNFTKYGITCWPEVLETAGIMEKLDPMSDNKPSVKWRAYYLTKTNDEGKEVPDKVDRMELVK